ncbi:unnamed protein product [Adineta steineri]|uniref:F5/8 type C domain-containing protein n=1 Tax=Adineta steineri TaxID=433720 RepID=A0A814XNH0_9BILA|nr:unnamed protein product [Adineta steineri]
MKIFVCIIILFIQTISSLELKKLSTCQTALGMQSGSIPDSAISVSSSYDLNTVGPKASRARTEQYGGAWCPLNQITSISTEWLEIQFENLTYLTQVETQGRFDNGQGREYADNYILMYTRSNSIKNDQTLWIEYKPKNQQNNATWIQANQNTYIGEIRQLESLYIHVKILINIFYYLYPPIVAKRLRFYPVSKQLRTICMRVEVYGCLFSDGIVSYSMPQGRTDINSFGDDTYDGKYLPSKNMLINGLGQLSDGLTGSEEISIIDGRQPWIGWSNETNYFATLGHHAPLQYNPADFIMDLVNQDKEIREELKEAYVQNKSSNNVQCSTEGQKYLIDEPNGKEIDLINKYPINLMSNKNESKWPIGFFAQTWVLFSRNWILTSKSQFTKLNFIQAFFITIVFGLFWLRMKYHEYTLQDRSSFIFFLLIFWPLKICFGGVLSFPRETSVINNERASGSFRLSAYYFAKCLSETPIKLVSPAISLTIMYWMVNVNSNFANFLGILCFLLMSVLLAESIGLFFGALFQDVGRAWVACNVCLNGFLLAVGYFSHSTPYRLTVWVEWISFFTYAYSGCMQLQFMGERIYQCTDGAYIDMCKNNINGTFIGNGAIKYFNLNLNVGLNFLVLFGMFMLYRIAAYIALRFSNVYRGCT